jgi:hypothetical protein
VAQCLEGGVLIFWRYAQPLEPVDEIGGPQEEVEVGLVGKQVTRGDPAKGVIPLELFEEQCPPARSL